MGILKRANLSTADIAQLADAVEPIAFADGEKHYCSNNPSFAHEGPTPSAEVAWSSRLLLHTPRLADQESRLSSTSFFTEDEGLLHIDSPSAFSRSPNHRERARPCFLKLGKKSTIGYTGPREADITSSLLLSVISAKDHTYVASLWVGQVPQPVR